MSNSPPRVLAILPGFIPSTIMCVVKPFLKLHQDGYIIAKITLERLVSKGDLKWADLVVFCRNTEPKYAHILNYLVTHHRPFIYELDDNFFELPLDSEFGKYHRTPDRLAMLTKYMQSAGLVRVYSNPLLEKAKILNPRVEQVVGPIDLSLIEPPRPARDSNIIKLVYGTSRIQDELSALFAPALARILKEYAGRIEAHFWGAMPPELKGCSGVFYHPVIRNYDRFLRRFSQAGFDIGLAPLPDDVFHRSKTNNKFREYGACRIAGIYSEVEVYSDDVTNGETGILVPNEAEAWYQAMVRLIENQDLREKIKNQARDYVSKHYSQENFEQIWWNQIKWVWATRGAPSVSNSPIYEIQPNPAPSSGNNLTRIKRLWQNGFLTNLKMLQWRLFDLWMIVKLGFYFRSSTSARRGLNP